MQGTSSSVEDQAVVVGISSMFTKEDLLNKIAEGVFPSGEEWIALASGQELVEPTWEWGVLDEWKKQNFSSFQISPGRTLGRWMKEVWEPQFGEKVLFFRPWDILAATEVFGPVTVVFRDTSIEIPSPKKGPAIKVTVSNWKWLELRPVSNNFVPFAVDFLSLQPEIELRHAEIAQRLSHLYPSMLRPSVLRRWVRAVQKKGGELWPFLLHEAGGTEGVSKFLENFGLQPEKKVDLALFLINESFVPDEMRNWTCDALWQGLLQKDSDVAMSALKKIGASSFSIIFNSRELLRATCSVLYEESFDMLNQWTTCAFLDHLQISSLDYLENRRALVRSVCPQELWAFVKFALLRNHNIHLSYVLLLDATELRSCFGGDWFGRWFQVFSRTKEQDKVFALCLVRQLQEAFPLDSQEFRDFIVIYSLIQQFLRDAPSWGECRRIVETIKCDLFPSDASSPTSFRLSSGSVDLFPVKTFRIQKPFSILGEQAISFQPHYTIFVGPSGEGKTTFFRAFTAFLMKILFRGSSRGNDCDFALESGKDVEISLCTDTVSVLLNGQQLSPATSVLIATLFALQCSLLPQDHGHRNDMIGRVPPQIYTTWRRLREFQDGKQLRPCALKQLEVIVGLRPVSGDPGFWMIDRLKGSKFSSDSLSGGQRDLLLTLIALHRFEDVPAPQFAWLDESGQNLGSHERISLRMHLQQDGCQIALVTHHSEMVPVEDLPDGVISVRAGKAFDLGQALKSQKELSEIARHPETAPILFSRKVLVVEGPSDLRTLKALNLPVSQYICPGGGCTNVFKTFILCRAARVPVVCLMDSDVLLDSSGGGKGGHAITLFGRGRFECRHLWGCLLQFADPWPENQMSQDWWSFGLDYFGSIKVEQKKLNKVKTTVWEFDAATRAAHRPWKALDLTRMKEGDIIRSSGDAKTRIRDAVHELISNKRSYYLKREALLKDEKSRAECVNTNSPSLQAACEKLWFAAVSILVERGGCTLEEVQSWPLSSPELAFVDFPLFCKMFEKVRQIVKNIGIFVMPLYIADIEGLIMNKHWLLQGSGKSSLMTSQGTQPFPSLEFTTRCPAPLSHLYLYVQPSGSVFFSGFDEDASSILLLLSTHEIQLLSFALSWLHSGDDKKKETSKLLQEVVEDCKSNIANLHSHWDLLVTRVRAVVQLDDHRSRCVQELTACLSALVEGPN